MGQGQRREMGKGHCTNQIRSGNAKCPTDTIVNELVIRLLTFKIIKNDGLFLVLVLPLLELCLWSDCRICRLRETLFCNRGKGRMNLFAENCI